MKNIPANTKRLTSCTHEKPRYKSMQTLLMCFSLFYFLAIAAGEVAAGGGNHEIAIDKSSEFIIHDKYSSDVIEKIIATDVTQLFNVIVTAVENNQSLCSQLSEHINLLFLDNKFTEAIQSQHVLPGNKSSFVDMHQPNELMKEKNIANPILYTNLNIIAHILTSLEIVQPKRDEQREKTILILSTLEYIFSLEGMNAQLCQTKWKNRQRLTTNEIEFGLDSDYVIDFERSDASSSNKVKMYAMEMPVADHLHPLYTCQSDEHLTKLKNEKQNTYLDFDRRYQKSIVVVYETDLTTHDTDGNDTDTYAIKIGYSEPGLKKYSEAEHSDEGIISISAMTTASAQPVISTINYFATDRDNSWFPACWRWYAGSKKTSNKVHEFSVSNAKSSECSSSCPSYRPNKSTPTSLIVYTEGGKKHTMGRIAFDSDPNQADSAGPCHYKEKPTLRTGCAVSGTSNKIATNTTSRTREFTDIRVSKLSNVQVFVYVTHQNLRSGDLGKKTSSLEKDILEWWETYSTLAI
ncbi:MAG: hypothetical protein QS721_14300 [Candidatus Endonucleobacter sp. (ex Gigantidas childressi)]|nr:hypothetical protein [Candidatus Endonucleobacter sp. (ex Gigantidas childressi)]